MLYQYERQYTMVRDACQSLRRRSTDCLQPVTRFNDLLQDEHDWENALSKGISFHDLDETQGNRTRNSLRDAFDELLVRVSEVPLPERRESTCARSFPVLDSRSIGIDIAPMPIIAKKREQRHES